MKTQQLQRTRQLQEDRRLFRFHTQAMVLVMAMTITMAMMLLLAWPSIAYAADQEVLKKYTSFMKRDILHRTLHPFPILMPVSSLLKGIVFIFQP